MKLNDRSHWQLPVSALLTRPVQAGNGFRKPTPRPAPPRPRWPAR